MPDCFVSPRLSGGRCHDCKRPLIEPHFYGQYLYCPRCCPQHRPPSETPRDQIEAASKGTQGGLFE